ncbi:UNVERIFIED_CONTAM: hypothetical protein RMT77_000452 [Armadillidium vulgare]
MENFDYYETWKFILNFMQPETTKTTSSGAGPTTETSCDVTTTKTSCDVPTTMASCDVRTTKTCSGAVPETVEINEELLDHTQRTVAWPHYSDSGCIYCISSGSSCISCLKRSRDILSCHSRGHWKLGKTGTKGVYRRPYSKYQTQRLKREFQLSHVLEPDKRLELANLLDLSERQIKVWFHNRRAKEKKLLKRNGASKNEEKESRSH